MTPEKQREKFFATARSKRYDWAKRVDPVAVKAFEQRTKERRTA
jgi:hypothetical protein